MPRAVFLSYSTDDTSTATALRDHLEAQSIACWMAPRDISPGKDYGEQIINAIEEASVLLLVLSESSNHSTFVRHEVERAVSKGKVIIPFRIQPVQPSRSLEFFISNYQWIDAWDKPLEQNIALLVQAIGNDLPVAVERPATSVPPSHNLPHHLTPFVGRERELAALQRLLAEPEVRLVTILGPGGMGKTRLALAAAERHLADPRFSNGIYFVALAPLSARQHIVLALADLLSLTLQPSVDANAPQQQLVDSLRSKQMLLLFDNFEHLLDGAELVAQILQAAPQVRVLATSRERLRIAGEHLLPIQGLDYSDGEMHPNGDGSAAVVLFTQIARQIEPEWELSDEELAQVTHICRLVGGMPLGIELAASWIELLSPAEIVAEIQRSLDFLEAERRGGQEQHRSMRAVFDSTWRRLDQLQQDVFVRLALFRGGFTREAAEQVAGASLRILGALVGKSLIQHEREKGRYSLHEVLRQFALEKLLADRHLADETHERLCAYYMTFLQQQEARLKGREYPAAMSAIETEIDNIRAAWQWGVAHQQVEQIDHSLEALWLFYRCKPWIQEGATLFGSAAETLRMNEPAGAQGLLLARLLTIQAWFLVEHYAKLGDPSSGPIAQALYLQSLTIFDKLALSGESGLALLGMANLAFEDGKREQGLEYGEQALSLFMEKQDLWKLAFALFNQGVYLRVFGDYQKALQYFRQCITISEQCGDLRSHGDALAHLGFTLQAVGEFEEAQREAEKSLEVSSAIGSKYGIVWSLTLLAQLAQKASNLTAAQQHAEASLALFGEMGLTNSQHIARNILGNVACSLGDLPRARSYFYPVLQAYLKSANSVMIQVTAEAATGMATVLAKEGKVKQAMEMLTAVLHNVHAGLGTKDRAAKLLADLASSLPDRSEVATRSLDDVVAEVLRSTSS